MASKVKTKNEVELLTEISLKLDHLIALMSVQGKERNDHIKTLATQGLSNSTIAKLLGIPKGTVDGIRAKKKK